jgi:hypothetical protein
MSVARLGDRPLVQQRTPLASDKQEWANAIVLADPQTLFVLWAISTSLCVTRDDFAMHFALDFSLDQALDELQRFNLVQAQNGALSLTPAGKTIVRRLKTDTSGARQDELQQTVARLRTARSKYARDKDRFAWASANHNLGRALLELAKTAEHKEPLLGEASLALRSAQEVYTRDTHGIRWRQIEDDVERVMYAYNVGVSPTDEPAASTKQDASGTKRTTINNGNVSTEPQRGSSPRPRSSKMKPLSQQLEELAARAKKAVEDAAAARSEARSDVQARTDKLQADAAQRKAKVDTVAASAQDEIARHWANLQAQLQANADDIKADIAATRADVAAERAERKAERAEDNAASAIAFAHGAIDYAESAVLDAIVARANEGKAE